jgi:hypothetical protein
MPRRQYNWKRLWGPRASTINIDLDGYLTDPETQYGVHFNRDLKTLDQLQDSHCLILLGEPGAGKTTCLNQSKESIERAIHVSGGNIIWLNLHSYQDEQRLCRDIFESPGFLEWKSGNSEMHLFLDSYDECLLRIRTLSNLLVDKLERLGPDRLRLRVRIASRGAVWPDSFEEQLRSLWGENDLLVYELAPLRRCDVLEAARVEGIASPDAFLRAVDEKQAVPLAIKPITLKFLLNTYRNSGSLPRRQSDLYRDGCLCLAEEVSLDRRESGLLGSFSAPERMAVAGRIAALMVFGGRSAIWIGLDKGDVPPEDVGVNDLSGSKVIVDGYDLPVSEPSARDALTSALFACKDVQRVAWAHQSYSEYLAAWHLTKQGIPLLQTISLLYHSVDGRVVPQLYGVAGWLAVLRRDVFEQIVQTDPDLILSADVAALDETLRASIVQALLAGIANLSIPYFRDKHWQYKKLAHAALAEQVRPYLTDRTKPSKARYEAIHIARECRVKSVQSELAALALEGSEDLGLRVAAAYTVAKYADESVKVSLKPLAVGLPEDAEDELKGCALRATWPTHMSIGELFAVLETPKNTRMIMGAYRTFIQSDLPDSLRTTDILPALSWIEEALTRNGPHIPMEEFVSKVFFLAWHNFELPGVPERFASALRLWLERVPYIAVSPSEALITTLTSDDGKRRRLIELMVPAFESSGKALMTLGACRR